MERNTSGNQGVTHPSRRTPITSGPYHFSWTSKQPRSLPPGRTSEPHPARLGLYNTPREIDSHARPLHIARSPLRPRLQVLKAANQRHRTKIALEVDVLRRLRHPNVVQFLGACTRSNPVTIVSEVLEGGSLGDALQTRPRPPLRRALEIALDCARGLNCLHCASPHPILHRDLKPDNIMLTRSHGIGQVCGATGLRVS